MSAIDTLTDEQIDQATLRLNNALVSLSRISQLANEGDWFNNESLDLHLRYAQANVREAASILEAPVVKAIVSEFENTRVDL